MTELECLSQIQNLIANEADDSLLRRKINYIISERFRERARQDEIDESILISLSECV